MTKPLVKTGLKVALPGYNAQTAPDYDLSFSSNWPMLQVVKTYNYTITTSDVTTQDLSITSPYTATVTFTHNLGYYAFADVWQYSADSRFTNVVAERLNSRYGYQMYFGKNSIKIPVSYSNFIPSGETYGQSIASYGGYYLPAGTVLSIKIYTFDFTQPFSYTAISPPVGPTIYDPHVGIKIVRPGRDINSRDLRNFIFHSKGSAPQILTVQTPKNNNSFVTTNSTSKEGYFIYQIPFGIPARIDFLYSTDTTAWNNDVKGVYESSTGLAYWKNVFGQSDIQAVGDVSYTLTNAGLFTGNGLLNTVPFSVVVRRDPLLYSAQTVITI